MNKNKMINYVVDTKKIKYFYFDLDGTLLNKERNLPQKNILALKKLMQNGYQIGIISGRADYMYKKEISKIKPNLPLVNINGAKITTNNKILNLTLIKPKTFQKIAKFLIANSVTFLAYNKDKIYYYLQANKKSKRLDWHKNAIKKREAKFKWELKPFNFSATNIAKICVIKSEISTNLVNKIKQFIKNFSDIYSVISSPGSLDLMPYNISKGSGLQFLDQNKIIDLKRTIVFGDDENDIPMFKVATFSVAMQNANEIVKKAATIVNKVSNNKNGVAYFINKVFINKKNCNI